ncbi:hypothetical protein TrispH2_010378 [Trichoplax sp. H2]|nr:hypothetical protein TrispH2_010378 [Trichoplax sp. H2]|eukprot:RDD37686.1 hypothetical protein TrispH2_010378 [Trichoplax sp. H2]
MTSELNTWKVPYVAHFCSLYRRVLGLFDFQIEDLEDDLLRDRDKEDEQQQSLVHELCIRLLSAIYGKNVR